MRFRVIENEGFQTVLETSRIFKDRSITESPKDFKRRLIHLPPIPPRRLVKFYESD